MLPQTLLTSNPSLAYTRYSSMFHELSLMLFNKIITKIIIFLSGTKTLEIFLKIMSYNPRKITNRNFSKELDFNITIVEITR
jgi:hypothetical protein